MKLEAGGEKFEVQFLLVTKSLSKSIQFISITLNLRVRKETKRERKSNSDEPSIWIVKERGKANQPLSSEDSIINYLICSHFLEKVELVRF